jgi:glycosyltransferase involved in cell wall biosynthesis
MPKVSVMMPVYNTGRFVGRAIQSILDQTLGDLELIIVDDGSTDNSLHVIQSYARLDRRIRYVSRENRGITASRNEALAMATGQYLANIDSDDITRPERLSRQANYLDEHPECVLVCCRMQMIDPDGDPICTINLESTHEEIDAIFMGRPGYFIPVSMMVRRDVLIEIGGFCEQFALAEDRDLCLRLAERGRLANIPEVLYSYRQHVGSVCRTHPTLLAACVDRVVDAAHQRRGLAPRERAPVPTAVDPHNDQPLPVSQAHRTWAWWALGAGNLSTARKHAARLLIREPFSADSWRILYCAMRGY